MKPHIALFFSTMLLLDQSQGAPPACILTLAQATRMEASGKLFLQLFPEFKAFEKIIRQFNEWRMLPSNRESGSVKSWRIEATLTSGDLEIEIGHEGFNNSSLEVTIGIIVQDHYDQGMDQVQLRLANTLSLAQRKLGIPEWDIFSIDHAEVTQYSIIPRMARWYLQRVAPTYGLMGPYFRQNELAMTFLDELLKSLEVSPLNLKASFFPNGMTEDIVKAGRTRIYLRDLGTDGGIPKVEVVFGTYFRNQFSNQYGTHLLRGNDRDFFEQLPLALEPFGIRLAPTYRDEYGVVTHPRFIFDLPEAAIGEAVPWFKKHFIQYFNKHAIH